MLTCPGSAVVPDEIEIGRIEVAESTTIAVAVVAPAAPGEAGPNTLAAVALRHPHRGARTAASKRRPVFCQVLVADLAGIESKTVFLAVVAAAADPLPLAWSQETRFSAGQDCGLDSGSVPEHSWASQGLRPVPLQQYLPS